MIEQVHRALAKLWEISTSKGLSPLVVNALGRSLRHLDGVRVSSQDEHRARYVKLALTEMRTGHGLMQNSANQADRHQIRALGEVVASLAPHERWADATLGAQSGQITRPGHEAAALPAEDTAVGGLITRLGLAYRRRAAALDDLAFPFAELEAIERSIHETLRALEALGDRPLRWVDDHPPGGVAVPDDLGAFAACIHLGDPGHVETAMAYLEAMARPGGRLAEATGVLGTVARPALDEPLHTFFIGCNDPVVRGALVPLLAERKRLGPDELEQLLEADPDPPAVAAAEMLAWLGGREQVLRLFQQAKGGRSLLRAHASLFAAMALGSPPALDELRRRIDVGECTIPLLEGLAIGGDESDVRRLLVVAARRGRLARHAALAAGHLGSPRMAISARGLPGVPTLDEALACTFGTGPLPHEADADLLPGRLWCGRRWSIPEALTALADPRTPVRTRERLALEIPVRTGVQPAPLYRAESSVATQARVAESWQSHWPAGPPSVAPWAYFVDLTE